MYRIIPPQDLIDTCISLPLSKSESARSLLMDALAGIPSDYPVAVCDDTDALRRGLAVTEGSVDIGAAGTAMRFLTAWYAVTEGTDIILDGSERMRHRPIAPLVDALRSLGADIEYAGAEGYAPLHIRGHRLRGGKVAIDSSVSSQFISALMMAGATMEGGLEIELDGEPVSMSYVRLTATMMTARGADVTVVPAAMTPGSIAVRPCQYRPAPKGCVGADWSAASYWYEVTALSAGWVALPGLSLDSPQGDRAMAAVGERLGVITSPADPEDYPDLPEGTLQLSASPDGFSRLDIDATDIPDLVPTLVVTAAMLGMPFHITGVSTLRNKETDRISALIAECLKFGLIIEDRGNAAIVWDGARVPITSIPVIDTYDDHRMAMAFAPASLIIPGTCIRDAHVVAKSYPAFWDDLRHAGFIVQQIPDDADPATYPLPDAAPED